MSNTRAYFVSDLHLVNRSGGRSGAFIRFLKSLPEQRATHLFLVGDVFDLWVADHSYFVSRFSNVVEEIRALVAAGIEIHYFEGNHDLHLTSFWQDDVGVKVHTDAATFELAGRKVRVEHGDLINPDDKGYLFLRKFLRSGPMTTIAFKLPSKTVKWIGERASRASRSYTSTAKSLREEQIKKLIRAHAERIAPTEPFDLIVHGHVHVQDDQEIQVGGRTIRSVNLGSWFDGPKCFVLDESGARFETLS